MIRPPEIWRILSANMPRTRWVLLPDIYQLVSRLGTLDEEDQEPQSPESEAPKWKRNVRNVLQYRKKKNELQWDGDAG